MAEVKNSCPPSGPFKEAVCIDAGRVYDSCCDRDCLEDLKLCFTPRDRELINDATSVKIRSAEVADAIIDVEPVHLNRGFFACDITFFFIVKLDVYVSPHSQCIPICGVCSYDKKVILYGSDGNVRVFSNEFTRDEGCDSQLPQSSNLPKCVVSCVDPIALSAKLCERSGCANSCRCVPITVCAALGGEPTFGPDENDRSVLVTLGLFTIVQLIRNVQMLVPVYDFCVPEKECNSADSSPCDVFSKIKFPLNDFFPPRPCVLEDCGCGCACDEE